MLLFCDSGSLYDFIYVRMFCTSLGGVGKHSYDWLLLNKKFEGLSGRCCDCGKFIRCRVLVQTRISKYECTVCAILAIRNYDQEECGYKLGSRFCLQDLKAWTKCICCRVACSGYHSVCITHLNHHYTIVWVLSMKDLFRFLRCHSFFCSQFYEFINVCLSSVRCLRIYDLCAGNIKAALCCFLVDLFLITDEDDLGNSLFQNLVSCLKSSHILCLWQYNCFYAFFCSFFKQFNKSHD